MLRFIHAADFHLDSAFTGLNEQQARQRRQESRDLTRRMVEYANDHGVQLMLLAGDAAEAFERLPIVQDAALLQNILYSGVWTRFDAAFRTKQEEPT